MYVYVCLCVYVYGCVPVLVCARAHYSATVYEFVSVFVSVRERAKRM